MVTKNPSNNDRVFKCILYSETDSGFFGHTLLYSFNQLILREMDCFRIENKESYCFHYQSKKETS